MHAPPADYAALLNEAIAAWRASFYTRLIAEGYVLQPDGSLAWHDLGTAVLTVVESSSDAAEVTRATPVLETTPGAQWQDNYRLEVINAGPSANQIATSWYSSFYPLDLVRAGDGNDIVDRQNGRFWHERADGGGRGVFVDAGPGDDLVRGTKADDWFVGGAGNDILEGTGGADTYFVLPGEAGYDLIEDEGHAEDFYGGPLGDPAPDLVQFLSGVSLSDLTFSWGRANRESTYITLELGWASDRGVRILIPHSDDSRGSGIEYFQFADGSRLTMAEMLTHAPAMPDIDPHHGPGTGGDDAIEGTQLDDVLDLAGGNDYAQGLGGNDTIIGGAGDDQLRGGGVSFWLQKYQLFGMQVLPEDPRDFVNSAWDSGSDVLHGGGGADALYGDDGRNLLSGGIGNDLLNAQGETVFAGGPGDDRLEMSAFSAYPTLLALNRGDGSDSFLAFGSQPLVVSLGSGIGPGDLALSRDGQDLVLGLGAAESLRIENWYEYWEPHAILQLVGDGVRSYDFDAIVAEFDALRALEPGLADWAFQADLAGHLQHAAIGSAYGGAAAYQYAATGSFDALAAQDIFGVLEHADFLYGVQDVGDLYWNVLPAQVTDFDVDDRVVFADGSANLLTVTPGTDSFEITLGDKTVVFSRDLRTLTNGSFVFADGSVFAIGDNASGTAGDDLANSIDLGAVSGNHHLLGFAGNDVLTGGTGSDTLEAGAGADALQGGGGTDMASYVFSSAGVLANLTTPSQNTGDAAGDTYGSIEGLIGTRFNDTLVGDNLPNILHGGDGNDYIQARGVPDVLSGGAGNDRLEGGGGGDVLNAAADRTTWSITTQQRRSPLISRMPRRTPVTPRAIPTATSKACTDRFRSATCCSVTGMRTNSSVSTATTRSSGAPAATVCWG
ncbi:MAG TPA: calcium-binding protein [Burkholderiales bacterium]|nr:calcium-binding protein [Burkholderiales bacterium]